MKQLEERILYFLGDTEFTDPDDLFAAFSMTPIEDMLTAITTLVKNEEARAVRHEGEIAYTRTMKGYLRINPQIGDDTEEIPF